MSLDITLSNNPCPTCGHCEETWRANITHNLTDMAWAVGIYEIVWRPKENGITEAHQLIDPLTAAIRDMKANPDKYRQYNSPNGRGMYENFVPWLEKYLEACMRMPEASVETNR